MGTPVFDGVDGFSGFFKSFDGENVSITFKRKGVEEDLDSGFLAQSYTATWQRGVLIQRLLNKKKPAVMLGSGDGTLRMAGLLGTTEGVKKFLTGDDVCEPLTVIITGNNSFKECGEDGGVQKSGTAAKITLTGVIPSSVSLGAQQAQGGILMQSCQLDAQFTGFSID